MGKAAGYHRQAATIVCRNGRVCLITTSSGKRWVVPKGRVPPGTRLRDTAVQEVWEEAGVVGRLFRRPVGQYLFRKAGRVYLVTVFRMKAEEVQSDWPERRLRQRRWVRPQKAVDLVEHTALRKILSRLAS